MGWTRPKPNTPSGTPDYPQKEDRGHARYGRGRCLRRSSAGGGVGAMRLRSDRGQLFTNLPKPLRNRAVIGHPGALSLLAIDKVSASHGRDSGIDREIDRRASASLWTLHDQAQDL